MAQIEQLVVLGLDLGLQEDQLLGGLEVGVFAGLHLGRELLKL